MHRGATSTVKIPSMEKPNPLIQVIGDILMLGYFTLLPIALTLALNWAVYYFAAHTIYEEDWAMPTLLLAGTFISGVIIRQKVEEDRGGLARFALGILGLILFAWITNLDIHKLGGIYSQLMPKFLKPSMVDYVFMLPAVGIAGMMLYKFFSLKNYD